jgi:hypothetical protein
LATINACSAAASFKTKTGGRERGQTDNSSFHRNGMVGDWVNHMSPELGAELCAPVTDVMRSLGYDSVPAMRLAA